MGHVLSIQGGHERLPSVTDERKKVAPETAEQPDLPRDMSISHARCQRQAELSQKDGLQRNPGPEGYTDAELHQWGRVLEGRRLFEHGEPISLEGIRQDIECSELVMRGEFGDFKFDDAPGKIRQAKEKLRQEALVPRSENDYDCEDLPIKSIVVGIFMRADDTYRQDCLSVRVNRKGIVTSVWNG